MDDKLFFISFLIVIFLVIVPLSFALIDYLEKRAEYYEALAKSLKEKEP